MADVVKVYKYDMSPLILRAVTGPINLPITLIGKVFGLESERIGHYGIWHTSIVVYDTEYTYGEKGVLTIEPGMNGEPTKINCIGRTNVDQDTLENHVRILRTTSFKSSNYDLALNNCNHFSNKLAQYLLKRNIPLLINILG